MTPVLKRSFADLPVRKARAVPKDPRDHKAPVATKDPKDHKASAATKDPRDHKASAATKDPRDHKASAATKDPRDHKATLAWMAGMEPRVRKGCPVDGARQGLRAPQPS